MFCLSIIWWIKDVYNKSGRRLPKCHMVTLQQLGNYYTTDQINSSSIATAAVGAVVATVVVVETSIKPQILYTKKTASNWFNYDMLPCWCNKRWWWWWWLVSDASGWCINRRIKCGSERRCRSVLSLIIPSVDCLLASSKCCIRHADGTTHSYVQLHTRKSMSLPCYAGAGCRWFTNGLLSFDVRTHYDIRDVFFARKISIGDPFFRYINFTR